MPAMEFMVNNEQIRRNKTKPKKVRNIKVQGRTRFNIRTKNTVPEIRMRGAWLEHSGFFANQLVSITTGDKILIIRVEESPNPQHPTPNT